MGDEKDLSERIKNLERRNRRLGIGLLFQAAVIGSLFIYSIQRNGEILGRLHSRDQVLTDQEMSELGKIGSDIEYDRLRSEQVYLDERVQQLERYAVQLHLPGITISNAMPSADELAALEAAGQNAHKQLPAEDFLKNNLEIKVTGLSGTSKGIGFWLTPQGHFVTAYHALDPVLKTKFWKIYQTENIGDATATIITADKTYEFENFLAIDPKNDIIIAKAKIDKPLDVAPFAFMPRRSVSKDLPIIVLGTKKAIGVRDGMPVFEVPQGKILGVNEDSFEADARIEAGFSGTPVFSGNYLAGIAVRRYENGNIIAAHAEDLFKLINLYIARHKK